MSNWTRDAVMTPVEATTGTTITGSHTLGSGSNRLVVVGVRCYFRTCSGVTYNGVAMTAAGATVSSGSHNVRMFYMLEASLPAAGSYNVVATLSGDMGGEAHVLFCLSFASVGQAAPEAYQTYANASTQDTTDDLSCTAEALMVAIVTTSAGLGSTITATGGGSQTIRAGPSANANTVMSDGTASAGTMTQSFHLGGSTAAGVQIAASFADSGGGGPSVTYPMLERFGHRGAFRGILH